MNYKLIALAFGKIGEAFLNLQEAFDQQGDAQPAASSAVTAAAPKAAVKAKSTEAKPAAAAKPKTTPKVETQPEPEAEDAQDEESQDDFAGMEDEAEEAVTKDQVRQAIVQFAKKNTKQKAYDLLEKYGSKNVDGLKDDALPKVWAEIQKGLK